MSAVPATLDDIQSDLGHLYQLLDALVEMQQEMSHVGADGKRIPGMDRADSLGWIARDMAEKAVADIDALTTAATRA